MSRPILAFLAVAFALTAARPARADIQTRGAQVWPGKHELSVHIGGQGGVFTYNADDGQGHNVGAGAATSGGRFTAEYNYQLLDKGSYSLWLGGGFNFIFAPCNFVSPVLGFNYSCNGDEFRPFAGVKLKFRVPIPLVPYARATVGPSIIFARYCDDNGYGVTAHLAGGAKYFLTKNIGVGIETGFTTGPEFYSGSGQDCGFRNAYYYRSHAEFYFTFDVQAGAEFIF